jgi:hypothetical protein
MSYTPPSGNAADVTWYGTETYTPPDGAAADASWLSTQQARISANSPLGHPSAIVSVVSLAKISAITPLGAAAILAEPYRNKARISSVSPLGNCQLLVSLAKRSAHLYVLTAYLSGGEDAMADYPIPLITFGLSKRSGAASYYSLSAPFTQDLIDAFSARPNGKIHINRDGSPWESFNVGHPIQYDIGPRSSSISISGTRQTTLSSSSRIEITPNMAQSDGINSSGELAIELVPGYVDPRPADVIVWDGIDYTVSLKKYQANAGSQTLSINAVAA